MCSIEWWHCRWPRVTPKCPKLPQFVHFAPPFIASQRVNLETSNLVHWFTIASPTPPIRNLPWKARGHGHVSNFYIVDLENSTASRRYTDDIHKSSVVGLFMTPETMRATRSRRGCVHTFITHCLQLNLQLHTIGLVRTCRISSFCTVAW